jgi:hypothetical protein
MHRLKQHLWLMGAVALAILPAVAHTQTGGFVPAVPAPRVGASFYGGGHASTLEEGALNGMANVMSAAGDYNLATSAAAINITQAQRNDIENRQLNTQAYFDIQATNRAARAQKAGPKPAMEQLTRIARQGAPKPLESNQFDSVTGALNWPATLMDSTFNANRTTVDQMFAKRAAQGTLGISDQAALRQALENLDRQLKGLVQDIQTQDYVESKRFLQSAMFTGAQRLL